MAWNPFTADEGSHLIKSIIWPG